jgi:hypothetical protein
VRVYKDSAFVSPRLPILEGVPALLFNKQIGVQQCMVW